MNWDLRTAQVPGSPEVCLSLSVGWTTSAASLTVQSRVLSTSMLGCFPTYWINSQPGQGHLQGLDGAPRLGELTLLPLCWSSVSATQADQSPGSSLLLKVGLLGLTTDHLPQASEQCHWLSESLFQDENRYPGFDSKTQSLKLYSPIPRRGTSSVLY